MAARDAEATRLRKPTAAQRHQAAIGQSPRAHGPSLRPEARERRREVQNAAARFGADTAVRQWRQASNVRHNAGFRSALHVAEAPVRLLRRRG